MALLSKEDILSADDKKTIVVEVPEWGGQVKVATMSGTARDAFEASCVGANGGMNMKNIRAKLLAATIVDDDNKLMFNEADVHKLGQKSAAALDRIFAVAQRINAISGDDVEELAKN